MQCVCAMIVVHASYTQCGRLLASERDTLSRSSMDNAIRIYIYIYR